MSPAGSTTKELVGQALVGAFVEDLKKDLEKRPGKSITDTKRNIVQMVVDGSPRLQHANINNLERQLTIALSAGCRSHMGIRYTVDPDPSKARNGSIMVSLV